MVKQSCSIAAQHIDVDMVTWKATIWKRVPEPTEACTDRPRFVDAVERMQPSAEIRGESVSWLQYTAPCS